MGAALEKIMPDTKYGLCVWHIGQNYQKHLSRNNKDGMNITGEFSACMFKYEEENEFEDVFNKLMGKYAMKLKKIKINFYDFLQ
jgi:hypothetical protein